LLGFGRLFGQRLGRDLIASDFAGIGGELEVIDLLGPTLSPMVSGYGGENEAFGRLSPALSRSAIWFVFAGTLTGWVCKRTTEKPETKEKGAGFGCEWRLSTGCFAQA
jgi:hypothetical protein